MTAIPGRGGLLARNTALNLIGNAVPLLIGIIALPIVIRGLGTDRYGLWALAGTLMIYFTQLDLGLGRSTTKFVAEAVGKAESHRLPKIVWTALSVHLVLGAVGGLAFFLLTPFLIERVFTIPSMLREEAKTFFFVLSASVPIVLCLWTLQGILEGGQRFDVVNTVKVPSSILNLFLPVVGIWLGFSLGGIAMLVLAQQILASLAYLFLSLKVFPVLRHALRPDVKILGHLFSYGGWIVIINLATLLLGYVERPIVGALVSLAAVAYFAPASSVISHLSIVPTSFFITLFPVFSTLRMTEKARLESTWARALKHLLLIAGPITVVLVLLGGDILHLWLGREFAQRSTPVLSVLAIGFFTSCPSLIFSTLLQGIGRPDIVAKIVVIEAPFYLGLVWLLTARMGIVGTALAWTLRAGLESLIFCFATWKVQSFSPSVFRRNGLLRVVTLLGALVLSSFLILWIFPKNKPVQLISIIGLLVIFSYTAWYLVLDATDKEELKAAFFQAKKRTEVPGSLGA